jgi:hypothetical protein
MTNNANQKRQPKGTSDGGKFAPDANPESTVDLTDDRRPTIRREVHVDTEIAAAYGVLMEKSHRVDSVASQIRYLVPNSMRTRDRAYMVIDGKIEVASVERLRTMFEADEIGPKAGYNRDFYADEFVKYDERKIELDAAQADYREKNSQYGGWSRFFLVPGGHIHSSLNCSTCNKEGKATNFGWLPELSGLAEDDAVKEHGAILCTVCYPSAPVEHTNKYELEKAAKAENRCPSSGTGTWRNGERLRKCPDCGIRITVTGRGLIRAHDKPTT